MSSHHPSPRLLEKFSAADLDGSLASVISAHVEHCSSCQKSVRNLEESLSVRAFDKVSPLSAAEKSAVWQKISLRLVQPGADDLGKTMNRPSLDPNEIVIDDLKFELPRSLQKFTANRLKWMPFGKSGKICKLGDENGSSLFLIYVASNEEVPLHSHEGSEYSYVVSGSYSAEGENFQTGDFSLSTRAVVHAPKAGSEEGCLILSSVESRLNFLHGWLSPFNGLLWWVLNFRVRMLT